MLCVDLGAVGREADPKVLIGGITLDNIDTFKDINVDGYAIVSAILKNDDIYNECLKWWGIND